jgi:hypothetical protein
MRFVWAMAAVFAALAVPVISARHPPAPDKPQLPKSQIPDLGRPTKVTDEVPPFNFDEYFLGKWTFEWDAPDGALGPAGTIKGSAP